MNIRLIRPLVLLCVLCGLAVSGCDVPMPGFRFAPGEPIRQSAQSAADLAVGISATGTPPGSQAAQRLAGTARAAATYAGPPDQPVDVAPLLREVRDGWTVLAGQAEAWQLRSRISQRAGGLIIQRLAELSAALQDKASVSVDVLLPRAAAIADIAQMGAEIAAAVEVPRTAELSPAERARLDELSAAVDKIAAAGAAQAARRPTVTETVERGLETTDTFIATVGGWLEEYGLLSLIPGGAAVGGIVYGARKRKQAREAVAEADAARHDQVNEKMRAEFARQTMAEEIRAAMRMLAEAPPPEASQPVMVKRSKPYMGNEEPADFGELSGAEEPPDQGHTE